MRRALRITVWSLAAALLLGSLGVGALIGAAHTRAGRRLLERETAQLTSGRVRLEGLGGRLPSRIEIARLQLSDPQGVWLSAAHISLRWSPLALLTGVLHIEQLEIGRLDVARGPLSTGRGGPGARSLVPDIDIDRLRIDALDLRSATAGPPARLTVRGAIHYRSMQDARVRLFARRTRGRGLYRLTLQAAPQAIEARLTLREPAGGPLEQWFDLPGLGPLAVNATLEGPRRAAQLSLSVRAGALRAHSRGTIDLERRAADLRYALASPALTPRPGLSWRRIALQGRCRGPLRGARASGELDLEGLRLADGARLGVLRAILKADGRILTVHATARHIRLPGPHPRLLRGSPLILQASLQWQATHRPLQLRMTDRLFDLRAWALTAGTRRARFALSLPDLAALARLDHARLGGSLRLSGAIAQRGASTHLEIGGTGRVRGTSLLARLLGARTRLRLEASLTPTQADITHLALLGRALSISATGSAERNPPGAAAGPLRSLRARWRVALPDLTRVSPVSAGSLEFSGSVQGPLRALALQARVRTRLSVRGSPPGTLQARVQARGLPSAARALIRATGTFDGAPLRLDASVERTAASALRLEVRQAAWKSLRINGHLATTPGLAPARGRLRLSVLRLADLQPLLGTILAGRLEGSVALGRAAGRASVRIELTGRDLAADGLSGDARVSASGPLDALRVHLVAHSPHLRGAPARLAATARLDAPARSLELLDFDAQYRGQTLRLLSPSRVGWTGGLTVRQLRLGVQRAVIVLDGQLSPALDVRASIHHLDAGLIEVFEPHLLSRGTLDAEAHLEGSRGAPTGRASFEMTGLQLAGAAARGLPAIRLRGALRLRADRADVSAALDAGPGSRLTLSGRAPLSRRGPLGLTLAGHVDAALMNAFLAARGERVAGSLAVDARVSGSLQAPRIRGTVGLAGGDLRDYPEGVHFDDINARLIGRQGVLRIERLTARAGPGRLLASGTIGILRPRMPIDLAVRARGIEPITNDLLTANLDADLQVHGTLRHRVDVTGNILIHHASIRIPNAFPPNVQTLEVIRPGEALRSTRRARPIAIGLGLTLRAPHAILVRGRGLDAQLGGTLEIAGTSLQPRVSGGFSMTRGTFSLAGTRLDFTSGRVGFNGEGLRGRIDPSLDFVAQTSVLYPSATTVTLRVTGFADAPRIALSSSPRLPPDELLALLLFGKPPSRLTPYELAETGAALASLGGVGGTGASRFNPLPWIRRSLGLNTLSVASAAPSGGSGTQTTGASLTAGRYLSNRVYVAATQTTQGTSQIRADILLTRHLKLETRLGNGTASTQGTTPQNDPGSSVGLSYQLRY